MFTLIDIGECAGSGIPNIYNVWEQQGWKPPVIYEYFEPERIKLLLLIEKIAEKEPPEKKTAGKEPPEKKTAGKEPPEKKTADRNRKNSKFQLQRTAVIEYLTFHVSGKNADFARLLGVKSTRVKEIMARLVEEDIVVAEGDNRERIYRLKE